MIGDAVNVLAALAALAATFLGLVTYGAKRQRAATKAELEKRKARTLQTLREAEQDAEIQSDDELAHRISRGGL